jgi:hypothetical protein
VTGGSQPVGKVKTAFSRGKLTRWSNAIIRAYGG